MKKQLWRVWYLPTNRCRKARDIEVEAIGKIHAYIIARKGLPGSAVILNAFLAHYDDGI